ncbi:hypothetical protein V5G98_08575 [Vibrio cholerae]|uniref:hypothetical protein n=1 Tax=Vibrio cholerae TaxID=666 RepID=UPI00396717E1|nr:hypothetical protein [Vibrio cholerae]
MLYFQQEAIFIQKEQESKIISRVKDNYYKHPQNGFVNDIIKNIPQKSFFDVIEALKKLDENFTLELQEMSKEQKIPREWLANLLLEIDQHNDMFGIDPQQTGNLLRHALRGMVYHYIIENDIYTVSFDEECPWRYIIDYAKRNFQPFHKKSAFPFFYKSKKEFLSEWDCSFLISELSAIYRQALIHFCSHSTYKEISILASEINKANIDASNKENNLLLHYSAHWAVTLTSIRQWTQYADRYWGYGSLFAIKAVLDALIAAKETGELSFSENNVIRDLSKNLELTIEEKTVILNTGVKTLLLLSKSTCSTFKKNQLEQKK